MNYRKILNNTLYAFIAQGVSFCLSVIQSLLVPKLLGVEQYAYWQLFIFYSSYVGFFHLGLNDGIYLLNGGKTRTEIDKRSLKSQYLFAIFFKILIAIFILLVARLIGFDSNRFYVICSAAIFMVVQNSTSYLMFFLQAINETKHTSIATIVNRFSYLIPLLLFLILGVQSYKPFIVAYVFSTIISLVYCSLKCSDMLTSDVNLPHDTIKDSITSIIIGSKLMVANIASTLVLGVLRIMVDIAWGIEKFGKLSFSLSLVSFFLAFVSQAAMVLFPALRRSDEDELRSFYVKAHNALGILFPAIYLLYFPMVWLLKMWLPAYAESLRYLAWLLPICVFDSKMSITGTTFFKVRRRESKLLAVNLITTICCAATVFASVFLIGSFDLAIASARCA